MRVQRATRDNCLARCKHTHDQYLKTILLPILAQRCAHSVHHIEKTFFLALRVSKTLRPGILRHFRWHFFGAGVCAFGALNQKGTCLACRTSDMPVLATKHTFVSNLGEEGCAFGAPRWKQTKFGHLRYKRTATKYPQSHLWNPLVQGYARLAHHTRNTPKGPKNGKSYVKPAHTRSPKPLLLAILVQRYACSARDIRNTNFHGGNFKPAHTGNTKSYLVFGIEMAASPVEEKRA